MWISLSFALLFYFIAVVILELLPQELTKSISDEKAFNKILIIFSLIVGGMFYFYSDVKMKEMQNIEKHYRQIGSCVDDFNMSFEDCEKSIIEYYDYIERSTIEPDPYP